MEQFYRVDATWDAQTGRLRFVLDPQGDGLWSPYLGNGAGAGGGTTAKGWGTSSCALDNTVEWVATGRISGCHIGFFDGAGGTRIAHLITPGDGYTAASVEGQIDAIEQATGSTLVHREQPWSVERRTPLTR
ncbi:hypothetical protein [Vannielia sp.]|uniref:hypothetical protein n=1 Tax=Vannielia sp. TaxID=2813045 RepID=UPI0026354810|nr:hypothetical protein [Vannielia sp.]MDF1871527.1 hypothetical protein [Vannielia sp.]